ncbi:MAG: hypothetical protein VX207_00750, partial [Candidatus Neomarinimicrobiota bacterium]|nr:hypothetical protein [Candidatus Neomarinimicrobiota bacterium]
MKKYSFIPIVVLLAMLFVGCGTSDGKLPRQTGDASSEVEEGLYLAHNVMWDLARDKFDEGIAKDPNCISCYLNKGHVETDRVQRRELYEKALELSSTQHPETELARDAVNWINGEGGRFDSYESLYKKYPNDPYLANGAARSLMINDQLDEARVLLEEAFAVMPSAGFLSNLLAYTYMNNEEPGSDEFEKASGHLRRYMRTEHDKDGLANALDSMGEYYLMKGDFENALANYRRAIGVNPNYKWGPINVARTMRQVKRANGEAKIMPSSTENQDAKNAFNVGGWYLYNIDWDRAYEKFSEAIELDPNFALAYAMRARTSFFLGNTDDLVDDLDIAVSMSLNASEDEGLLINALAIDVKDGTSTFNDLVERLAKKYSDDSMLAFETIFATMTLIGSDAVIEKANALLTKDPDMTPAYNMLGYAYIDKGDLDNAGKALQSQVRLASGMANPYDS